MELKPLKVCEINQYIKRILNSDPLLHNIRVEGEISNLKQHYNGHLYFSLKDDKSKINCVMFGGNIKDLDFKLQDGMSVITTGYISVYEKSGSYQLYVKDMKKRGIGELFEQFEKLKVRLENEGLFDAKYKKSIPLYPKKIGVVTSPTGAAVKDIITVIKRRYPIAEIIIYPVLVQGNRAHEEICEGLKYFDSREDIDIVITGRGGGSIEELWAFNEEDVARTVFNMKTPVISAVGHETDFTIIDFVADLRAPTPSAAGEIAVPSLEELNKKIDDLFYRLKVVFFECINSKKSRLDKTKMRISYNNPIEKVKQEKRRLDYLLTELTYHFKQELNLKKNRIISIGEKLDTLSPFKIIQRGYALTVDRQGYVIKSVKEVKINDEFKIKISDGDIDVKVIKIQEKHKGDVI